MTSKEFLSHQEASILSEGICPLCQTEVEYVAGVRWRCPKCFFEFELVADTGEKVEI